jgi:hypothetical protein
MAFFSPMYAMAAARTSPGQSPVTMAVFLSKNMMTTSLQYHAHGRLHFDFSGPKINNSVIALNHNR